MKKIWFILLFVITHFSVNAQQYLEFPVKTIFHDVNGDHFLAAYSKNDKAYIMELNLDGTIVWQDSLDLIITDGTSFFNSFIQFANTDEFLLIAERDINTTNFIEDTTIYQFIKISTSTQEIVSTVTDTLFALLINAIPYKDTSILVFNKFFDSLGFDYPSETFSLDVDLNLTQLAPLDSIQTYSTNDYQYVQSDTLYILNYSNPFAVFSFSEQISHLDNAAYYLPTGGDYNYVHYCQPIGMDSLLIVSEKTTTGSIVSDWNFAIVTNSMSVLVEDDSPSPNFTEDFVTYYNGIKLSGVIVAENKIYVLANQTFAPDPFETIFVYDFGLNLLCEIPVLFGPNSNHRLNLINQKPYFARTANGQNEYYEINNCAFTLDKQENKFPNDAIIIYPNPANDILNITLTDNQNSTIEIFDLTGQIILTKFAVLKNDAIDISNLQSGIYIVRVSNGDAVLTKKFTKI